jgi:hypothetical protein
MTVVALALLSNIHLALADSIRADYKCSANAVIGTLPFTGIIPNVDSMHLGIIVSVQFKNHITVCG